MSEGTVIAGHDGFIGQNAENPDQPVSMRMTVNIGGMDYELMGQGLPGTFSGSPPRIGFGDARGAFLVMAPHVG